MKTIISTLAYLFIFQLVYAQEDVEQVEDTLNSQNKKSFFGLSGNLGVHYDYYNYSTVNLNKFRPRYPESLFRFTANANLRISEYFNIPISISVTNQKTTYNLPQIPEEGVVDYIKNPKNNISIMPTWRFIKAKLGTHTPNYSKLTTGNIPVFGVGLELTPGTWITEANYGTSQLAVEPDKKNYIPGAYSQKMFSARIGKGSPDKFQFVLNAVKVKDDINSITNRKEVFRKPLEGISFSPLIRATIFKKIYFETETAVSATTNNLLSDSLDIKNEYVDGVKNLITVNGSTHADLAHNTLLEWRGRAFKIGGEVQYIGAGYIPAGYRNFEKDILDYKVNTGFSVFKGKFNFNGSFGIRTNNLQKTKALQTRRFIGNLNANIRFTNSIMLNLTYSNFGFNNTSSIDFPQITRIEMNNSSIVVSPVFTLIAKNMQHQFNLMGSLNSFNRFDVNKNDFIKTKSKNIALNYTNSLLKIPFSFNLSGVYYSDDMAESGSLETTTLGGGVNYYMFMKKLNLGLRGTYMMITRNKSSSDNRVNLNIRATYKIFKKTSCTMQYNLNNYAYGESNPGASFIENKIQLSIIQNF